MKPFWPPTLQLLPVHLQARDAYVEALLHDRAEWVDPLRYGVIGFTTDEAAWQRGVIAFTSLSVLFPNGLLLTIREPLRRDAAELLRGPTTLYIAIPKVARRGPNVAARGANTNAVRFATDGPPDEPWLSANAQLVFKGERTGDLELVRLGRVERNGERVQWQAGSMPAVLRVRGSPVLQLGLEKLVGALEQRQAELLRARKERPFRLAEVKIEDLPPLQLLAQIQRYLPLLRDQARRQSVSPRELYGVLVALHGSLAAGSQDDQPPPAYDHETPTECFPKLFRDLRALVDELARDRTTMLPFERLDAATFRLVFKREALVGKRPFLVATGADETFLRDRIPSLLKMASPSAMPALLQSALRGVSIAVEFEPAASIPRRADVMTYRLDTRDPLWLDIEDRGTVLLYVPSSAPTLTFTLYGVERAV